MTRLVCMIGMAWSLLTAAAHAQHFPYERFTLDNGLTVILHQDESLPVAAVNIWYRVGAKDEPPRRSGFAHLYEHLMFMGTQRVPEGEFDRIMEAGGGSNNATTAFDRTNYFSSGPSTLLPVLLWLDAERLEDVGRTMTQEKLDSQRDVVRNELRETVENAPYGRAYEIVYRHMYPPGHPYHDGVIGSHEDLLAATVNDVRDFFATFYIPNNASLVVAGDFDPAETRVLIAELFGDLPRGPLPGPPRRHADPVTLTTEIRRTQMDNIELPLVRMVWHSPAYFQPGDAEMDLLGSILAQGTNSRLYQRLVMQEGLAVSVSSYQASSGLGSLFFIDVLTQPGTDLVLVGRTIDEELLRLVQQGIAPEELQERQAVTELSLLTSWQSIERIADKLNEYEYYRGEPDSFAWDLERYRSATPQGVRQWAQRVLNPGAPPQRLLLWVLPIEPPRPESAREAPPPQAQTGEFHPEAPQQFALGNGIPVLLWHKPQLPLVSATVLFAPGEPITDPNRAGAGALAAAMLDQGAGELDATAFAAALQSLGAQFRARAEHEWASASLTVLKRNFGPAARLLDDALRRPRLEEADWQRIRRIHLEALRHQEREPALVAARIGNRALFGPDHPYGWPAEGTPDSVAALTLEEIRREHARIFEPRFAAVLVAGDLTIDEARAALEQTIGGWPAIEGQAPQARPSRDLTVPEPALPGEGLRLVIVDRPEASQTVIRFAMPAVPYRSEQRTGLRLLNTILGGAFTSRLNQNLRERHGFTYGAASRYVLLPSGGYFIASASVDADATAAALREFLSELERLAGGDIADAEVAMAREMYRADVVQSFATLGGIVSAAAERLVGGLPVTTLDTDLEAAGRIDAAALNQLGASAVPVQRGVAVLVGNAALIRRQLQEADPPLRLGPVIQVDVRGQPVP
jgi:zinc protease